MLERTLKLDTVYLKGNSLWKTGQKRKIDCFFMNERKTNLQLHEEQFSTQQLTFTFSLQYYQFLSDYINFNIRPLQIQTDTAFKTTVMALNDKQS